MSEEMVLGSGAMFDVIARRYDLMNRLISFGADQRWRRRTVRALELAPGHRVLDVATGTADLALAVARAVAGVSVVGVDPSAGMRAVAARKIADAGLTSSITIVDGDAQALDFPDASFDRLCMGFGIRNVPNRPRALAEAARVLRPGGRLAILELNEPRRGPLAALARLHVHVLVPWLGALLSGAPAYRYLERSIARFPPPDVFAATMRDAGLEVERVEALTFGVATLFVARRS